MTPSLPSWFTKAPSTLIRFQTKTELFCSVFKKTCVHTSRFRIVFARPHYNAPSVLKMLLYPQCACSNKIDSCAFQYIGPWNWSHIEASVRHFGYSRSSGLAPSRVYFDDVTVFRWHRFLRPHEKTAFSKSIVFKSFHSGGCFGMVPFSVIVFGVVAWTMAVSVAKQLRWAYTLTMNTIKWNLGADWLIAAGAYPGFCSMERLGVFPLPLDGMLVHRTEVTHRS